MKAIDRPTKKADNDNNNDNSQKGKEREGSDRVGGYHDPGQRFSRRQAANEDKTLGGGWVWGGGECRRGRGGKKATSVDPNIRRPIASY